MTIRLMMKLNAVPTDLLLLDMVMQGKSGMDLIALVKSRYPGLNILVLSARDELQTVQSALRAGASG